MNACDIIYHKKYIEIKQQKFPHIHLLNQFNDNKISIQEFCNSITVKNKQLKIKGENKTQAEVLEEFNNIIDNTWFIRYFNDFLNSYKEYGDNIFKDTENNKCNIICESSYIKEDSENYKNISEKFKIIKPDNVFKIFCFYMYCIYDNTIDFIAIYYGEVRYIIFQIIALSYYDKNSEQYNTLLASIIKDLSIDINANTPIKNQIYKKVFYKNSQNAIDENNLNNPTECINIFITHMLGCLWYAYLIKDSVINDIINIKDGYYLHFLKTKNQNDCLQNITSNNSYYMYYFIAHQYHTLLISTDISNNDVCNYFIKHDVKNHNFNVIYNDKISFSGNNNIAKNIVYSGDSFNIKTHKFKILCILHYQIN